MVYTRGKDVETFQLNYYMIVVTGKNTVPYVHETCTANHCQSLISVSELCTIGFRMQNAKIPKLQTLVAEFLSAECRSSLPLCTYYSLVELLASTPQPFLPSPCLRRTLWEGDKEDLKCFGLS